MEIFTYLALVITPAILGGGFFLLKRVNWANRATIGLCFTFLGLSWIGWRASELGAFPLHGWGFRVDSLALILSLFILFVMAIVHHYSVRYMSGDRKYDSFFAKLGLLTSSLLLMLGADHLVQMLLFWTSSNLLLASLMIHKQDWSPSQNSGKLICKLSVLGASCMGVAIFILFQYCATFSLNQILANHSLLPYPLKSIVLILLITAALIQSGAWPFHKWLVSSLNSPTPVSGLMHAGLVNGGGFLLTRFAPLFSDAHPILHTLFILGLISVVLGTGAKLIQNNVKKMLACSTMAQMGFMLMQCGLGFFSAAIAHLFWHGLFKCYLFLNSGSAVLEQRDSDSNKSRSRYLAALLAGLPGAYGFGSVLGFSFHEWSSEAVLILFSWFAAAQIAYSLLVKGSIWPRILIGSVGSFLFGLIYGWTIYLVKFLIAPLGLDMVLPLSPIHIVGICIVTLIYTGIRLNLFSIRASKQLYVQMVNFSQSDPKTINAIRSEYQY